MSIRENEARIKQERTPKQQAAQWKKPPKSKAALIEFYIDGVSFPATKSDLLSHAEMTSAPATILYAIQHFSDREYLDIIDIYDEAERFLYEEVS